MSLACDAGQVVVVGSPRGKAKEVNFYDDLHRRYIEVTGAHGNMLFEPAHTRLAGAWDIDKAQKWLLRQLAAGRLSLAGLVTHTITPGATRRRLRGAAEGQGQLPRRAGEVGVNYGAARRRLAPGLKRGGHFLARSANSTNGTAASRSPHHDPEDRPAVAVLLRVLLQLDQRDNADEQGERRREAQHRDQPQVTRRIASRDVFTGTTNRIAGSSQRSTAAGAGDAEAADGRRPSRRHHGRGGACRRSRSASRVECGLLWKRAGPRTTVRGPYVVNQRSRALALLAEGRRRRTRRRTPWCSLAVSNGPPTISFQAFCWSSVRTSSMSAIARLAELFALLLVLGLLLLVEAALAEPALAAAAEQLARVLGVIVGDPLDLGLLGVGQLQLGGHVLAGERADAIELAARAA